MNIKFDEDYEVLIIGGGAIGANIALDFSSRGFKTLLIEQNDFASGTSSKSTKLLHGGVRYLEKAVNDLDLKQYNLVNEALNERAHFLNNASHLSNKLRLLSPIEKWYEGPYYYFGLKLYDLISKEKSIGQTSYKNEDELIESLPFIDTNKYNSAIEYFDGSFNDAKLVIDILKTAQNYDCSFRNYNKLEAFIYKDEKIVGIKAYDKIKKNEYFIKADIVINASGHYVDSIRKADDENSKDLTVFSKGSHFVISNDILNIKEGLLIPNTKDGRVLFVLPWLDYCLIGTTDIKVGFSTNSNVSEEEIDYLLTHINSYFNKTICKKDILSSWSGLRTLIKDNNSSKDIVREHIIEISKSNLVSICGGKWTTSRKIAQECTTKALKDILNTSRPCLTKDIKINGSYSKDDELDKKIDSFFEEDIKKHLINTYGINALKILDIAKKREAFKRLLDKKPFIEAELLYCLKYEFVKKPMDFLARRIRLAFLDKNSAKLCLSFVVKTIKIYFDLNKKQAEKLLVDAKKELDELF